MKINKKKGLEKWLLQTVVFYILFFCPFILFAQIEITEIMYNPGKDINGSTADGGREWVEIYNPNPESINLVDWRFYVGDDKHYIRPFDENDSVISEKTYALLVADIEKFKIDYPDFSGVVFGSSFSPNLSNTGSNVSIDKKDLNINEIQFVTYSKEDGANGDGNSLQKIDGVWKPSAPTPGEVNYLNSQSNTEDKIIPSAQVPAISSPATVYKIEPQVFGTIILPQDKPIAGADFLFSAVACGLENNPLDNAEYQWTFGDGSRAKGQKVLYAYQYPGEYMVVLEVISGKYTGSDRLKIVVLPSDIVIASAEFQDPNNQFIEFYNPSVYELNLSWWRLKADNNYFTFPKDTIILPKKSLKLSSKITNLFTNLTNQISLLYPNGSVAFVYQGEKVTVKNISIPEKIISPSANQTASLQKAVEPSVQRKELPESEENVLEENFGSTSQQDLLGSILETKSDKNLFDKWTISLGGIVILAIGGVLLATKLDQ